MKLIYLFLICFATLNLSSEPRNMEHKIYLDKTDFELHVFEIHGKIPGPTLMIIGGIQGDEPSGYLAADIYSDVKLKRGNLIVVPRANFLSIMQNRRKINQDMNRLFDNTQKKIAEDDVVEVLKKYINKADILLNLHEGTGFYRPEYVDEKNNPDKYGQSIVADAEEYHSPKCNCDVELKKMAEKVIKEVNSDIDDPKYHFRFNNQNTASKDTAFPEQKKSATYYALYTAGIPAFAVETSKNISDLELKVSMHSMIINEFMKIMGIVMANPLINIEPAILRYVLIKVNDEYKLVSNGDVLFVPRHGRIEITAVETNYRRGVTADVLDVGSYNDIGKVLTLNKDTKIMVRKDSQLIAEIPVNIK
ncbi:MAG: M14/M99 family metallopeptidase [Proteobacteria bacterium]|nr:M14/M99 family metallopeptidase [Pseudomonadota bacterium]